MTQTLRRIMLVEDDPDIAVLTSISLGELGGYEVVHHSDGRSALAGVKTDAPDLLLLDYTLPDMTGADVLLAVQAREETSQIPAIFMTASVMPEHVGRLKELGALEVFAKPFDPLTLPARVQEVWDSWAAQDGRTPS
jgi:CheY-like chemotaxis protein